MIVTSQHEWAGEKVGVSERHDRTHVYDRAFEDRTRCRCGARSTERARGQWGAIATVFRKHIDAMQMVAAKGKKGLAAKKEKAKRAWQPRRKRQNRGLAVDSGSGDTEQPK